MNFEDKKKEYLDKIANEGEVLDVLNANPRNKEWMHIINDPQDEKELAIANAIITYFSITIDLVFKGDIGNYDVLNFRCSIIMQLYIDTIKAIKTKNEDKLNKIINYLESIIADPIKYGTYMYEYYTFLGFLREYSDNLDFLLIANECGFKVEYNRYYSINDYFSDDEFCEFVLISNKARSLVDITTGSIGNNSPFASRSEEEINICIEAMKEYERLFNSRNEKEIQKTKLKLYK